MGDDSKNKPVHPDMLEALKNLDKSNNPQRPSPDNPQSATGFAALLAKGGTSPEIFSPLGSVLDADTKASRNNVPPPRPQPSARASSRQHVESDIPEAKILEIRDHNDQIFAPRSSAPERPRSIRPIPPKPRQQDWYRIAIPIMLVVGTLLVCIGFWAIASLAGLPNPLIPQDHDSDRYHTAIKLAWGMLLALPIGATLNAMALFMLYRLHWRK